MVQGTSQNKWTPGMEGVRVTVILADTRTPVTQPIDFTNKRPTNIQLHFRKVSKLSYNKRTALSASGEAYTFVNPRQSLPRIISSVIMDTPRPKLTMRISVSSSTRESFAFTFTHSGSRTALTSMSNRP